MNDPIVSVSGMRGIVGDSLLPNHIIQYVASFAKTISEGPVVVTRDGRSSGSMIAGLVISTLTGCGKDVLYGDVAATPTTGVLVRHHAAAAGIQISASHNPIGYNGLKLFGPDGRVISDKIGKKVVESFDAPPNWATTENLGEQSLLRDTTSEHIRLVLETVDVERIQKASFRVLIDSNAGAGSIVARQLMERLNVYAEIVGDEPNGAFLHEPEPTSTNLVDIAARAKNGFDVVFCQDPDADRLAVVDEAGKYIGEEYTLALTLKNRLSQESGPCVINCATSRMAIDIAEEAGCQCHVSAVGEANVCDEMLAIGAVYGGEGNGGPIDPKVGMVRDSFVGMAQILDLMVKSGKSISQLVGEIPAYAICKQKTNVDRNCLPAIFERLQNEFSDAKVSLDDGIRFDWPRKWLLVRASNTEPIVRVICETESEADSTSLAQQAIELIQTD